MIEVVYNCPTAAFGPQHWEHACRFASTLHKFPAEHDHKFTVVSNGGKPDIQTEALFAPFAAEFFCRANIAKDIGAWQGVAEHSSAELIVFLGGSTYIRGAGWLRRMVEAFRKHGDGLYGCMVNTGDQRFSVSPHIRTTGFWTTPWLMNKYPERIIKEEQRYPFEHGPNCLTTWVSKQGLPALLVTWTHEYALPDWGKCPNGFHRGDQSGILVGDHLSEPPLYPFP